MTVYVYCITEDYPYKSSITGRSFENEWFRLSPDGMIMVKGTNSRGYSWDGFRMAGAYYRAVRLFGWIWWGKPKFVKRLFGRP